MQALTDLKAILHSKRANIFYLEYCRVMQKDGRVLYLTESKNENSYWNIPIANTTVILLGTGTSVTQAAMRMLCSAGVLVGFCGSDATPLFAGSEIEWLTPQGEYRPTEYVQNWLSFWFDESKRLEAAKHFQQLRIKFIRSTWDKDRDLKDAGFCTDDYAVQNLLAQYEHAIGKADSVTQLLQSEALATKKLYKFSAETCKLGSFTRDSDSTDKANTFLNHGNYLAYGSAACALWVLGIPHGFAVMHGKTRRGALVFDVADLIKDAVVLPYAFLCARDNMREQEFRQQLTQKFTEHHTLDFMFDSVKETALTFRTAGESL